MLFIKIPGAGQERQDVLKAGRKRAGDILKGCACCVRRVIGQGMEHGLRGYARIINKSVKTG